MKQILIAAMLLIAGQACAQYGLGNPNRTMQTLGYQTTARGIIHYASGAPNTVITWRTSKDTSAYFWCDTLTSRLYNWNHTGNRWYSVGVFEAAPTPAATLTNGPATIDNRQAFWFNTGNNTLYFYDRTGAAWAAVGGGSGADNWGLQVVETDATLTGDGTTGTELGIAQQGATSGQVLKWNGTAWAPDTDIGGSAVWGAISGTLSDQGDLNTALSGKANTSHTHAPADITQGGATSGQVLKWNGSAWAPANDTDTDTDAQTLSFSEPDLSISGGNTVDLSGLTPTTEEIQDDVATMVTGNTETRIAVTYDDPGGKLNFVVEGNLSNYTNDAGFLTSEVDGSITNEAWTISDGTNTELINSQTVVFADGGIVSTLYDQGTNTLTISATEIDGSTSNELQTISYNATTDEITLSAGGGTIDISEVNTDAQTLSWNGSTGEVTISGGNTVDIDGRYLPTTLNSAQIFVGNGSNVATGVAMSGDATITNAGAVTVDKVDNVQVAASGAADGEVLKWSDANSRWEPASDIGGGSGDNWGSQVVQHGTTLTGNGTSGSPLDVATDGITANEIAASAVGTSEVADNTLTATDLAVDVVSSLDGVSNDGGNIDLVAGGIVTITPDDGANTITISATEVDGSVTNEAWVIDADDSDTETISNQTVKFQGAGITSTDYNPSTDVLLITSTEVDGSITNEIQDLSLSGNTLSLTGDGTTVDLSPYLDNTDAQSLTITGSAAPYTVDISGGTDVSIDAGAGIGLSESPANTLVITNTGDTDAADDLTTGTSFSGDVSGAYNNLQIGSGTVGTAEIANGSVAYADIQNVSATDRVLGRSTAGAGVIEEITMTAAGRALVDDASAADQRTTLGLGTIATQSAASVTITGGSITGITDLTVADGGTGASTAADARTNLGAAASGANTDITSVELNNTGLTIDDTDASHQLSIIPGSNLTADRTLTVTTGDANRVLTFAGDATISGTHSGTSSGTNTGDQTITLTGDVTGSGTGSFAATIATGAVDADELASTAVTPGSYTLASITVDADGRITAASNGSGGGTNYQTLRDDGSDATGQPNANFVSSADIAFTLTNDGANSETEITADIPAAAVDYAEIQNVSATDRILGRVTAGAGTIEEITCTAAGRAIIDDADAAAQRTTLGLGTMATQAASAVSITGGSISGITDLAIADGGTGAGDAATARSNLGAAASGANTDITSVILNNTGLVIKDSDASHNLTITTGSNLTAARTLTINPGDAARTLTLGGNATISGGTHSGTNTGDQTISLTGDVTGSGTGSFAATIANNAVTDGKFRQSAALTVVGRSANSTGNVADIAAGSDGDVLRRSGTTLGFGTIATAGIADDAVTMAKIAQASAATGQVIAWNGTDWAPQSISAALISVNAQTGTTYTLVIGDAGKLVTTSNASAITLTVPPNSSVAFPTGTVINICSIGAGQTTIAPGSGVTIGSADSKTKLRVQYSSASLIKTGTDTWILVGDLSS